MLTLFNQIQPRSLKPSRILLSDVGINPLEPLGDEGRNTLFSKEVYREIIDSEPFKRLKEIRFLGAIDYVINPAGGTSKVRYTRHEHSLRVGQLALQFSQECGLNNVEEAALVVAALLHDIGHAPLSHSLERTFVSRFKLNHHLASQMIIGGSVPLGARLPQILKKHGLKPEEIIALIEGRGPIRCAHAFKHSINIDTIEAIPRSYTYISKSKTFLSPTRVLTSLIRRDANDVEILDEFWRLKNTVYDRLITGRIGLLADYVCQRYMETNPNLWKGTYFHSETELRKRHSELFARLRDIKTSKHMLPEHLTTIIRFQKRSFYINESIEIKCWDDIDRRYLQKKEPMVLDLSSGQI